MKTWMLFSLTVPASRPRRCARWPKVITWSRQSWFCWSAGKTHVSFACRFGAEGKCLAALRLTRRSDRGSGPAPASWRQSAAILGLGNGIVGVTQRNSSATSV